MIVKNESKIITRLLKSVEPLIDSYCICDTGSSDNTIEMIENFFDKRNIKGTILREPFRDFGYNRTFALQKCCELPDVDYILLLDADMVLEIDETFDIWEFKNGLSVDAYYLYQGSPYFLYKNIRLIKNQKGLSYWGVTHEYLYLPKDNTNLTIEQNQIFIRDIGDGGAKQDKFLRDIQLLEKGLIENPDEPRYLFYLANSYRDSDQYEKAIEIYQKRILQGGWYEEVWHSYYSIGNCYESLNDMPNAIYYWLEAFHKDTQRIENLYKIIKYYREQKYYRLAYHFYNIAKEEIKGKTKWDHLFLQKSIYDYYLDYEFSIIGYYCNIDNKRMRTISMNILMFYNTDTSTFHSVLNNYKYYCENMVLDNEYMPLKKLFMEFYKDSENHSVYLKSILNADEKRGILHSKMKCRPTPIQYNNLEWYIGKIVSTERLKFSMFIGLDADKKIHTYSPFYPMHLLLQ
jgi:glycosyltransferase involved in cell wall biosynthesis